MLRAGHQSRIRFRQSDKDTAQVGLVTHTLTTVAIYQSLVSRSGHYRLDVRSDINIGCATRYRSDFGQILVRFPSDQSRQQKKICLLANIGQTPVVYSTVMRRPSVRKMCVSLYVHTYNFPIMWVKKARCRAGPYFIYSPGIIDRYRLYVTCVKYG